jgi:hypothetical protein
MINCKKGDFITRLMIAITYWHLKGLNIQIFLSLQVNINAILKELIACLL